MKRTVDKVIDGDTFRVKRKVNGSNYIRLPGFDAPEINTRGGQLAKNRLTRAIGKNVTIQPRGRSYGRVVADVRHNRKNVSKTMKKYGY